MKGIRSLQIFHKEALVAFGISGGLSFFVVVTVLMFRLSFAGIPPKVVGFFALTGIPYNIRILWPFLIDRVKIPYLSVRLGQYRSWGIVTQVSSIFCFLGLGLIDPVANLELAFVLAFFLAFVSALHDIVSEAYRFSFFASEKLPHSTSVPLQTLGFRLGQFLSGAVLPILASSYGWQMAHFCVVIMKLPAIFFLGCFQDPYAEKKGKEGKRGKEEAKEKELQHNQQNRHKNISFFSILKDHGIQIFLLSIILLRVIDTVLGALQTIFLGKIGITQVNFGLLKGGIGMIFVLLGVFVSGILTKRWGIFKVLFVGISCQSMAGLGSIFLLYWKDQGTFLSLVSSITAVQDFFQGVMSAALLIYISSFCHQAQSVYRFTLFSTISSLSRVFATVVLTDLQGMIGWTGIFLLPCFLLFPEIRLIQKTRAISFSSE